jgi:hypothetical protein
VCVAMREEELKTHRQGYGKIVHGIKRDKGRAKSVLRQYLVSEME